MLFLLMQGYEDGDDSSAGGALQKKRKDSAASSQGSKASATAGTGDKQTLKSEKEDGEKDEYADDFDEDKTEGKIQCIEKTDLLHWCYFNLFFWLSVVQILYFVNIKLFCILIVHSILLLILFVSKAYGYIPLLKYVQVVCLKSNEIKEETNVEWHK